MHYRYTKSYIQKLFSLFPTGKIWFSYPAFYSGISLVFGIILAYYNQNRPVIPLYNFYSIFAISFLILFALVFNNSLFRIISFLIIGFLLFTAQNLNRKSFFSMMKSRCLSSKHEQIDGFIISIPFQTGSYYSFLLSAEKIIADTDTIDMKGKILKCYSNMPPPCFQAISGQGKYNIPHRQNNPYAYDEYLNLTSKNIWGKFTVKSFKVSIQPESIIFKIFLITRSLVIKTISHIDNRNIKGILHAVFLGEKDYLSTHVKNIFRNAGIYHLLAISGLHVVILITSLMILLKYLPIATNFKTMVLILAVWFYLFFIGFTPSIFRAVIMATIILLSNIIQKNSRVGNSLFIAGILWLIISPQSLFSPGFQLSFTATFGIITLFPIFKNMFIPKLKSKIIHFIISAILSSFFVSLSGFIATAPVIIYHFGEISFFGLIANIFAVFLMSLSMNTFCISIFFQVFTEKISVWFSICTEFLFSTLISLAEISDYFPYLFIKLPVPYTEFIIMYVLFILLFIFIARQYRRYYLYWSFLFTFVISPIIIYIHFISQYVDIAFFNTKDGSAVGIRFPNKKVWLIGYLPTTLFNHPYKKCISPWMRHTMISYFDAILIPFPSNNIVHFLDPIITNNKPGAVITCISKQRDILSKENFQSYIGNNNLHHIQLGKGWKIIPSPHCTCTIIENGQYREWYEPEKPAVLKFTLGKTILFFNSEKTVDSLQSNDSHYLRINNVNMQYQTNDLIKKRIYYSENQKSGDNHNTGINGSVRIRLKLKSLH